MTETYGVTADLSDFNVLRITPLANGRWMFEAHVHSTREGPATTTICSNYPAGEPPPPPKSVGRVTTILESNGKKTKSIKPLRGSNLEKDGDKYTSSWRWELTPAK